MICGDQLAGPGHVLNDRAGITRNVFSKMAPKHPAIGVKSSAGSGSDNDCDRLSSVKLLRGCGNRREDRKAKYNDESEQVRISDRHGNSSACTAIAESNAFYLRSYRACCEYRSGSV